MSLDAIPYMPGGRLFLEALEQQFKEAEAQRLAELEEENVRRANERGEAEYQYKVKQLQRIRREEIKRHNEAMAAIDDEMQRWGIEVK